MQDGRVLIKKMVGEHSFEKGQPIFVDEGQLGRDMLWLDDVEGWDEEEMNGERMCGEKVVAPKKEEDEEEVEKVKVCVLSRHWLQLC